MDEPLSVAVERDHNLRFLGAESTKDVEVVKSGAFTLELREGGVKPTFVVEGEKMTLDCDGTQSNVIFWVGSDAPRKIAVTIVRDGQRPFTDEVKTHYQYDGLYWYKGAIGFEAGTPPETPQFKGTVTLELI